VKAELAARGFDLVAEFGTADEPLGLPDFGRASARAVVVGNTRALWGFVKDLPGPDPVDTYAERVITEEAVRVGVPFEIRWAHHVPATIAIQRAAAAAGLAWLSPSHLCVHPVYGPWIGLRAVVVFDQDAVSSRARLAAPCSCDAGCMPAFERACAAGVPASTEELRDRWRLWLAVRDACPVGRSWRYSEEQISWHYTGVQRR
jgi:methylmalonic aciduria homocystinuria type C protein